MWRFLAACWSSHAASSDRFERAWEGAIPFRSLSYLGFGDCLGPPEQATGPPSLLAALRANPLARSPCMQRTKAGLAL